MRVTPAETAEEQTTSARLVAKVRQLCHDERNERFEATPLQAAALELCEEYEIAVRQNLALEAVVHEARR